MMNGNWATLGRFLQVVVFMTS